MSHPMPQFTIEQLDGPPDAARMMAIERIFFQNNVRTAMSVGQVSGLCMVEAASLEPERSYYLGDKSFDEGLLRKKIRKLCGQESTRVPFLLSRRIIVHSNGNKRKWEKKISLKFQMVTRLLNTVWNCCSRKV